MEDIYNGTYTNWDQIENGYCRGTTGNIPGVSPATPCSGTVGAQYDPNSAPIIVVRRPGGSGTQSTWKTFLGFDPVTETTVNCTSPSNCAGPLVIFENELAELNTGSFTGSQQSYVNSTSLWARVADQRAAGGGLDLLLLLREVQGELQDADADHPRGGLRPAADPRR